RRRPTPTPFPYTTLFRSDGPDPGQGRRLVPPTPGAPGPDRRALGGPHPAGGTVRAHDRRRDGGEVGRGGPGPGGGLAVSPGPGRGQGWPVRRDAQPGRRAEDPRGARGERARVLTTRRGRDRPGGPG